MKNWKDFDWTDNDGEPLPPQFQWAAIDWDGSTWAYDEDCEKGVSSWHVFREEHDVVFVGNYPNKDWKHSKVTRYTGLDEMSCFTEAAKLLEDNGHTVLPPKKV